MNWYTRRLVESIFDNPDLMDVDDGSGVYDEISNDVFYSETKAKIISIVKQNMFEKYIDVSYEIINGCIFIKYTHDYRGGIYENYLNQLTCEKPGCVEQLQELFDIFQDLGIKYCGFYLLIKENNVNQNVNNPSLKPLNFNGITFFDINQIQNIKIQNFILDKKPFLEDPDIKKVLQDIRHNNNGNITNDPDFYNCEFENSVIKEVDKISLEGTYGLKDFSFVKQVNESMSITIYNNLQMLPTNDFKGLPDGNYKLDISFRDTYQASSWNRINSCGFDNRIQTFYGVPESISELNISSDMDKYLVFDAVSLEGIPLSVVNKTKIKFKVNGSRSHPVWVQYGCKKKLVSQMRWGPNKQELKDILTTKDFFFDTWKKNEQPRKEYIPPKESSAKLDLNLKAAARQNKAQEQKLKDAKEDTQLMIDKAKDILEEKQKYQTFTKTRWFYIVSMTDDKIKINFYAPREGLGTKEYSWEYFIKKYMFGYTYLTPSGESLRDLIYIPVEERRERILAGRERQAKRQRKNDVKTYRAELKKERQSEISNSDDEQPELTFDQDAEQIIDETPVKRDDIEVVDYSERAYAVFGNTYDIKDELKEIGASYNKWLKYGSGKKPGWIIGKRKKAELEKIIGQFD